MDRATLARPHGARPRSGMVMLGAMVALSGCFSSTTPAGQTMDGGGVAPKKGCGTPGASTPTAPGGYYTSGATVCTAAGVAHLFHGVDRPSLEFTPTGIGPTGPSIPASDFQQMASWHANVVRIATNQDFWLKDAYLHNNVPAGQSWSVADAQAYQETLDQAVHDAEATGLDVILDLHWSDQGNLGVTTLQGKQNDPSYSAQQYMADVNSKEFWSEVATKYKNDGHVIFELYNEPNGIDWGEWLSGGSSTGYQVVGMQELYDTIRGVGAENLVIAGGLSYAFDLSGIANNPIVGHNIMYATHDYPLNDSQGQWGASFEYLLAGDIAPVIATEFGDNSTTCTGAWDTALTTAATTYGMSWTAWAWFPGGCSFPSLISDWTLDPTGQGTAIQAALMAFPAVTVDAGMDAAAADAGDAAKEVGTGDATLHDGGTGDAAKDAAHDTTGTTDAGDAGTHDAPGETGNPDARVDGGTG
jgi:endoglucanase